MLEIQKECENAKHMQTQFSNQTEFFNEGTQERERHYQSLDKLW